MSDREKRTVRIGAMIVAAYLVIFFGVRVVSYCEQERRAYVKLVADARVRKEQLKVYEDKVGSVTNLMASFRMDPAKLSRATVVAEASAAIQKAATGGGIQLGPIRESPARATARELAQIQFEGTGPLPAILGLLNRLEGVGYPLVVDAVQLTSDPTKPGMVKLTLTILILDFEQWKKAEASNA
jgi:hypothetical protein